MKKPPTIETIQKDLLLKNSPMFDVEEIFFFKVIQPYQYS